MTVNQTQTTTCPLCADRPDRTNWDGSQPCPECKGTGTVPDYAALVVSELRRDVGLCPWCDAPLDASLHDACREERAKDLVAELSAIDTGDGTLGIVIRQALADDPRATADNIREIWAEATADAAAERENEN